jgi:hypothetical protein
MKGAAKVLHLLGIFTLLVAIFIFVDLLSGLKDVPATVTNQLFIYTFLWIGVGITQTVLAVHINKQETMING